MGAPKSQVITHPGQDITIGGLNLAVIMSLIEDRTLGTI